MGLNLIEDQWIPIRSTDGQRRLIAPWEVTDPEIAAIDAPRADFQANLLLFLIGLYQTVMPPKDHEEEWFSRMETPPSPDALRQKLSGHAQHFNLVDGPTRFMQEPSARDRPKGSPAVELLMETPTGQTLKLNKDLFTKRSPRGALCLPCVGIAVFTLQANAPEGGRGQNVSLRGGGPLTTVIQGRDLWSTIWSNVVPANTANPGSAPMVYPWEIPVVAGGKEGRPTTPLDAHPLTAYWGCPRRIHLDEPTTGACAACGTSDVPVITSFRTAPNGFQYQGWLHPLSPAREDTAGKRALRTPGRAMTYRDWLGLVIEDSDNGIRPAAGVRAFRQESMGDPDLANQSFWMLAFGYQTKQNSVLAWHESRIPLQRVATDELPAFNELTRELVRGAQTMANTLLSSVKQAMFRRPKDATGDLSYITLAYWNRTEPEFYAHQAKLAGASPEARMEAKNSWHRTLCTAGDALFHDYVLSTPFGQTDPQRVAVAWTWLRRNMHSKKTREAFGLPPTASPKPTNDAPMVIA